MTLSTRSVAVAGVIKNVDFKDLRPSGPSRSGGRGRDLIANSLTRILSDLNHHHDFVAPADVKDTIHALAKSSNIEPD